jgi:FdhD protein
LRLVFETERAYTEFFQQENFMQPSINQTAIHWDKSGITSCRMDLLGEEPLSIRVQGKPYSVVMRTPGEEIAHVAGFCLGEGIIDAPGDYSSIAYCDAESTNVVTVTLTAERRQAVGSLLDRRSYISQTSCGLCGKELVQELHQLLQPVPEGVTIPLATALAGLQSMAGRQTLRGRTHASHAAALCDVQGKILALAEDIGRHNALDKAIGKAFLDGSLRLVALLTMSSRVSYELVQKAARGRIPVILSVSRPTGLAVELASRLNMGLACLAPEEGAYLFCGQERFQIE